MLEKMKLIDKRELLSIHLAVFLFGASGLFAKFIPVSALLLTLGRALFSSLALYMFIHFRGYSLRFAYIRDYAWNILAGVFLTIHWFFFIMSIQVSTVYIGTIMFATYPMFVLFIEPYVFKEKFQMKSLITVIMIGIGIAFFIPAFKLNNATTLGIIYGLISSLAYALLGMINRRLALSYNSVVITLYEQTVATLIMTLIIALFTPHLGDGDVLNFVSLIVYGVIFTALAHSLYIHGLTKVKTQTASIISVLEPVYSIFLAILFLHERLTYQEIIGTSIILIAVILAMIQNATDKKTEL